MSNYIKNRRIFQKYGVFDGAMGAVAPPKAPYLTITNKSTSLSVNKDDFIAQNKLSVSACIESESKLLLDEILVRSVLDPDGLRDDFRRGLVKMLSITPSEGYVYRTPNVSGNPLCRLGLNKKGGSLITSFSDNANFTSRNRLINLIKANPSFCYFFTGTFDPRRWNRKDFAILHSSLTRWLRRRGIKYIIIPEPHKDGSIHFHGFFDSTIEPYLKEFDLSTKLPKRIRDGIAEGREIYNCPAYADMFGWVSIERIRNLEACAVYAAKYVSKTFEDDSSRFSYHRYFCSLGLNRPFECCPSAGRIEGLAPVRFSSIIPKVYLKQSRDEFTPDDVARLRQGTRAVRHAPSVAKNSIFTRRAQARKNEGGTVKNYRESKRKVHNEVMITNSRAFPANSSRVPAVRLA